MKNIPAFPRLSDDYVPEQFGMSLRDYFAAKAMQGILSNPAYEEICKDFSAEKALNMVTTVSFGIADAMLKAREE